MPHKTFSQIYLHIVWHTFNNEPLIKSSIEKFLYAIIRRKCEATPEVIVLEIGGTDDHLHLAVKVPPTLLISKWIGELKGVSSYELKHSMDCKNFSWQEGYGVISFKEKDSDIIVDYIRNQKDHHLRKKLFPKLEKIESS